MPYEKVNIQFLKTHPDAVLPTKAHNEDNCFDLYAVEDTQIFCSRSAVVPVGLTVAYITPGFGFVIRPRSGLGFKYGLQPHLGEIDNGYRGDLSVKVYNFSSWNIIETGTMGSRSNFYQVKKGDRIAQIKVEKVWDTDVSFVDEIVPATRGEKGFGSSGK